MQQIDIVCVVILHVILTLRIVISAECFIMIEYVIEIYQILILQSDDTYHSLYVMIDEAEALEVRQLRTIHILKAYDNIKLKEIYQMLLQNY